MKVLPPNRHNIGLAAEVLAAGGLVIMPTETVYGLACDAANEQAVHKVYKAKGRPADNPLIVHIQTMEGLEDLVLDVPSDAKVLAERFWPGPLTMVFRRHPAFPAAVAAGLETVAVRIPAHPVALSLIKRLGRPIAAPSANPFMALSPTRVDDIDLRLGKEAEIALDGGPSRVGLESTVVDVTEDGVQLLRPGSISRAQLEAALGHPLAAPPSEGVKRSPGMYARHYAPRATLKLVDSLTSGQPGLVLGPSQSPRQIKMPQDPRAYSAALYNALHRLDRLRVKTIYVQRPPDLPEWEAVLDRLVKASTPLE